MILKNTSMLVLYSLVIFGFNFLIACNLDDARKIETKGIYGHPQPLWNKGYKLSELGVNAIFVGGGSIDEKLMHQAKNEGVKIYAEFPTLNGKGYVENHMEAWAVDENGKHVEAASWFMGVCPTEPGFKEYRFNQLRKLLTEFDIDGVWMDYLHWHAQFEEPEPLLFETCFCENCLSSFSSGKNLEIPAGNTQERATWILNNHEEEWRDWRCEVIAGWASEMRGIMDELKPGILLGVFHCPWNDEEFDGARRQILGLDYNLLREQVNVFSPMVYHARMGRRPEWVAENIDWFSSMIEKGTGNQPKVWPIVQAFNDPDTVSASEFDVVLRGGLQGSANGVMMFTTRAVADDPEKLTVMKNLYAPSGNKNDRLPEDR